MSIIREINGSFAVPDLRNSATVFRLLGFLCGSLLLLPLISGSEEKYINLIREQLVWILPTLGGVLVKAFLVNVFAPSLKDSPYHVVAAYVSNLMIFAAVEYLLPPPTRTDMVQYACLFNLFMIVVMYMEGSRRNSLVPAVAEARLSALTARIRPHFLFNSLNAAISLVRLRPYDAETLLENLANLFRAQLRDASQSSTLGQEIEWAQEYISIEQIRMGHMRVQVMWQHFAPDDAETPHLLLQPLLENAVFHGVESSHRPGTISVLTRLSKSFVYIRIENPYQPPEESQIKPHKGNSMALHNLKERLMLMYDNDAKLHSRMIDGKFRVDIRLPYRRKTADRSRPFG